MPRSAHTSSESLPANAWPGFKVPGLIRIVPEIPKGPGGKVKRGELGGAFSIRCQRPRVARDGKTVLPRSEMERQLAKIWADLLELEADRR